MGVRTFGTGHSFTPIIETAGLLLDTQRLRGVIEQRWQRAPRASFVYSMQ